jgi:hypothetical protein
MSDEEPCSIFSHWLGIGVGMISFDFKKRMALLRDNGIHLSSATTLDTTGSAVVAILSNAFSPNVKNRFLHISDFKTSQAEILSVIEGILGGDAWTRTNIPVKEFFHQSMANIDASTYTVMEIAGVLTAPFFGGGTAREEDDNKRLGLGKRKSLKEVSNLVESLAVKV